MFCAALMFIVICAVILLNCFGKDRAAFRIISASQDWFQPEHDDAPSSSGARQSGVKVHGRRVTPLMKKKIGEQSGWKCACGCGQKLSFDYHVDHIVPLWKGGTNDETNLQALNPRCHVFKTSMENAVP